MFKLIVCDHRRKYYRPRIKQTYVWPKGKIGLYFELNKHLLTKLAQANVDGIVTDPYAQPWYDAGHWAIDCIRQYHIAQAMKKIASSDGTVIIPKEGVFKQRIRPRVKSLEERLEDRKKTE